MYCHLIKTNDERTAQGGHGEAAATVMVATPQPWRLGTPTPGG